MNSDQQPWVGPEHEGDPIFEQCNAACSRLMTRAEAECQSLWNALHAHRSSVVDVGGAMAEVNRQCLAIRAEARKECERVRETARSARVKLAESLLDFTY